MWRPRCLETDMCGHVGVLWPKVPGNELQQLNAHATPSYSTFWSGIVRFQDQEREVPGGLVDGEDKLTNSTGQELV